MGTWRTGALLVLTACTTGSKADPSDTPYAWPLDDVLRLNHLQGKGTHNSYHVETTPLPEWSYTHAPLGEQLEAQGVRQFELDVTWDAALGVHRVFHLPDVDEGTTCETLTVCVADLWTWSSAHPGHHPILILVEAKDPWDDAEGPARLDALDADLLSVWPADRLIRPDDLGPDLADALAANGWPHLGELRGRALFVLHDGGARRAHYVADLAGRAMFPDAMGDLELPWAAVHTMNDPWDPDLPEVVAAGHFVRTRADDEAAAAQALEVGAHFLSTDYPAPVEGFDFVLEIPGGTPSRCNPATAPGECTPEAIETPDGL